MENTQYILLVIQIIIAVLMIVLVLLQKSDGDSLSGLSSSSAGLNSVISGKASMSILSKITMVLIAIFMINCLILASISKNKSNKLSDDLSQAIEEHNSKAKPDLKTLETAPKGTETPTSKPSIPAIV